MKTVYMVVWQFAHGRDRQWREQGDARFQSENKAEMEALLTELQTNFSGHANYALATIEIPS